MALVSRLAFATSHSYKNIFSSAVCFPFRQYNYGILCHSQFKQILPCLQQHYKSTIGGSDPKKNVLNAEISTRNKLSQRARLQQAVRDYGATIIVFHVAISLVSLGLCYLAISNGVDAVALLKRIGFPESVISSKVAVGSSTFVMSYAIHKLFAPVRIGITLSAAPFIVRYLRKVHLIKPPK